MGREIRSWDDGLLKGYRRVITFFGGPCSQGKAGICSAVDSTLEALEVGLFKLALAALEAMELIANVPTDVRRGGSIIVGVFPEVEMKVGEDVIGIFPVCGTRQAFDDSYDCLLINMMPGGFFYFRLEIFPSTLMIF